METTFNNVTITITAIDSKEAYGRLCSALAALGAEFTTDTFSTDLSDDCFMSTKLLMPAID
jgi:hypothetical protein